jgi:2,3-diaminopropionate biosynthesis protein sbnB
MPSFTVLSGSAVKGILDRDPALVLDLIRDAYLLHENGETINPDSYFLRFPERPEARIIALPAYVGGSYDVAGIKWISSFPKNVESGLPRASAVLILNDYATGYPIACMEAAAISATRTAASAALAATALRPAGYGGSVLSFIGGGVIARYITDYLHHAGVRPSSVFVHDIDQESGRLLAGYAAEVFGVQANYSEKLSDALAADTVVLATSAEEPYITTPLRPGQLFLNISLRDLAPELILDANNVFDDAAHCMRANTSPHLAEQKSGGRDFVTGTLAQVLRGDISVPLDRPVIFSPFGLGVLDLVVGTHVLRRYQDSVSAPAEATTSASGGVTLNEFFAESTRW